MPKCRSAVSCVSGNVGFLLLQSYIYVLQYDIRDHTDPFKFINDDRSDMLYYIFGQVIMRANCE